MREAAVHTALSNLFLRRPILDVKSAQRRWVYILEYILELVEYNTPEYHQKRNFRV